MVDQPGWYSSREISYMRRPYSFKWKRISGGRPFVLKGIQSAEDARKAYEIGCEGIVVTNHAGRQIDGAVGSLAEIADAVGDSGLPVLYHSDRILTILFKK